MLSGWMGVSPELRVEVTFLMTFSSVNPVLRLVMAVTSMEAVEQPMFGFNALTGALNILKQSSLSLCSKLASCEYCLMESRAKDVQWLSRQQRRV